MATETPKDSETGTWGNAPGCNSEEYQLPFGFLWDVCSAKNCGIILGLKLGLPEDDGKISHGLCDFDLKLSLGGAL